MVKHYTRSRYLHVIIREIFTANRWTSRLALEDAVFENTLPLAWKHHKAEKQRSDLRSCSQQHPESRLSPKKPFPFEALMAMTKDRQIQQGKATTNKEVSETRAL